MKQIFIVVQINEASDLYKYLFYTEEEARMHLEKNEYKAYLIIINGTYEIEDHT